jgi:hypothetical protein
MPEAYGATTEGTAAVVGFLRMFVAHSADIDKSELTRNNIMAMGL